MTIAQRLWGDKRGTTLVLVTGSLTALIGFTGLAVETGLWYTIKHQNQSAADVAALSGAFELAAGLTNGLTAAQAYPDTCALAQCDARRNNFTFAEAFSCPASSPACTSPSSGQMCTNNPPVLGAKAKDPNSVEVILSQAQNTAFASLFLPNVTILTRAVATITDVTTCMIALNTTGTDLLVNGGGNATNLEIPNCAFVSDSTDAQSILLHGNVKLAAGAIDTAGNWKHDGAAGSISPQIVSFAPQVANPYGSVSIAPVASGCTLDPAVAAGTPGSGSFALVPGTDYCSLTVGGSETLTIPASVYYLVGGHVVCNKNGNNCGGLLGNLTISGGTIVNGSGVTFVLTAQPNVKAAGSITITGGSGNLGAPTSDSALGTGSAGLLVFQDPNTSAGSGSNTIAPGGKPCGSSLSLTGAIVTSLTADNLQGNQVAACSTCTELIAASYTFSGTPSLDTSQCSSVGVKTQNVPSTIALSE